MFLTALCRSDEKLELQWTLEGHQLGVVSVDISHNGAIAASSSLDAHIRLWDLESGKQVKSMDAGPGEAFRQQKMTMVTVFFSSLTSGYDLLCILPELIGLTMSVRGSKRSVRYLLIKMLTPF